MPCSGRTLGHLYYYPSATVEVRCSFIVVLRGAYVPSLFLYESLSLLDSPLPFVIVSATFVHLYVVRGFKILTSESQRPLFQGKTFHLRKFFLVFVVSPFMDSLPKRKETFFLDLLFDPGSKGMGGRDERIEGFTRTTRSLC